MHHVTKYSIQIIIGPENLIHIDVTQKLDGDNEIEYIATNFNYDADRIRKVINDVLKKIDEIDTEDLRPIE